MFKNAIPKDVQITKKLQKCNKEIKTKNKDNSIK